MLDEKQLLELYKIAIDEYRFEVDLNWQRTKYYCTLNVGIITISTGLLKINEGTSGITVLVALIFFIGIITSFLGVYTIKKGNIYYKRTLYKKFLYERELGLLNFKSIHEEPLLDLSVATTLGMEKRNKTDEAMKKESHPPRKGSIKYNMILVLYLLSFLNFLGLLYTIWQPAMEFIKGLFLHCIC